MTSRDRFEKAIRGRDGIATIRCSVTGKYYNACTEAAWFAWQAAEVDAMAAGMEHIAYADATYAAEHDNHERAFAGRVCASSALVKATAVREGRLSADWVRGCRGKLSDT